MTSPDGRATPEDQKAAVGRAAGPIADLVAAGHEVLVTHGNGPQVGNLLLKNELAASVVPPVPLDWCGAQTQATIGMLLMNALDLALAERGIGQRSAALVSRTLVDRHDAGFLDPTKPIGRYLTYEETEPLAEHGQRFTEIPGRGWRRVVASPEPRACLDAQAAHTMLAAGYVVVCSGGGGIPTVRRDDGTLEGVEAVIDKDLSAALLADVLDAQLLVIATDVEGVVVGWGTPEAEQLGEVEAPRLRALTHEQHFAAGSMGPKVEAVLRFTESTGGTGIITALDRLGAAVAGRAGTRVVPPSPPTDRS